MSAIFLSKALVFAAMSLGEVVFVTAAIACWLAVFRRELIENLVEAAVGMLILALVWGALLALTFSKLFGVA